MYLHLPGSSMLFVCSFSTSADTFECTCPETLLYFAVFVLYYPTHYTDMVWPIAVSMNILCKSHHTVPWLTTVKWGSLNFNCFSEVLLLKAFVSLCFKVPSLCSPASWWQQKVSVFTLKTEKKFTPLALFESCGHAQLHSFRASFN